MNAVLKPRSAGLVTPRTRGLIAVRADGNPMAILAEMKKTFEDFKAAHEEELKGIKKNFADVVTTEKMNKINSELDGLTKALDETNKMIAAMKIGGAADAENDNEDKRAHNKAFAKFFRKGVTDGLSDLEVKAELTTQSDPSGGYLVPRQIEKAIDDLAKKTIAMRRLATVMPIGTQTYQKFVNMGGASSGWVGEQDDRTQTTTPTLRELVFNVMEVYAEPYTTQIMLDDGIIDIAQWLADEVTSEFDQQEGAAFIAGSGVKKPRGILAYDTVANANWAWGKLGFIATGSSSGFIATTTTDNPADCMIDLFYALKERYRNNASWLISDAVMGTVRKFKDADGNYIWATPAGPAGVPTILQKPVVTDDNMQPLGANAFPIAFGDFKRGYLILDRMGIRVLRNPYKVNGKVAFYTTKRVGGGVQHFEAIKLLKCA
jgi:HK97 family phage major capsid protein